MTIGRFDRGCWFLIICALAVLIEGKSGVLESWFLFHGKRYGEERVRAQKRRIAFDTLSFATEVRINSNGLLDKPGWPDPVWGRECIEENATRYACHRAYAPSSNSFRIAAIPDDLSNMERDKQERFLYVLQVFVKSNQISKIEIVSDKKEYFSYDLIADYLEDYGYAVNAVTNDGMCAYICSKP